MAKAFLEALLQVLIVIPFILFFLKEKSKSNFQRIFIFAFCYIVYQIIIVLPKFVPALDFIKSSWNWDGKILGIVWAVASYFLFKNYFRDNNFFTLKQHADGKKSAAIVAIALVLVSTIIWLATPN